MFESGIQIWYICIMNNRGQNVVEYILLITAVVLVFIVLMAPQGRFHKAVETNLNSLPSAINSLTGEIKFK